MHAPLDISVERLTQFVEALENLPPTPVDMYSPDEPVCGTPGCHAGLISLVAEEIPQLKGYYNDLEALLQFDCEGYDYSSWASALARFITEDGAERLTMISLATLAESYPDWWGNAKGELMFSCGEAFGQETDRFQDYIITAHWAGVLERTKTLKAKE